MEKVSLLPSAIARRVPEGGKQRRIGECMDAVVWPTVRPEISFNWNVMVDYMVNNDMKLLLTGEEDQCVVLPEGMFCEQALSAVHKNLRVTTPLVCIHPSRVSPSFCSVIHQRTAPTSSGS